MAGNHEATENEYLNKTFSFDRKKLDIKSAENKDTLTGLEKTFLAYVDLKSSEGFPIAGEWIYQHFIDPNYLISMFAKMA